MADLTVRDVLSDPEFHSLPPQEQHKVMSRIDPEWTNMRPADRQAVLSQSRDRTMQNANPSTVPGMGVIPHLGVGLGGGQPPQLPTPLEHAGSVGNLVEPGKLIPVNPESYMDRKQREGTDQMKQGWDRVIGPGDFGEHAQGASDMIHGVGSYLTPAGIMAGSAAPLPALSSALAGGVANYGVRTLAPFAGASEGTSNLLGDVAGLGAGTVAGLKTPNISPRDVGNFGRGFVAPKAGITDVLDLAKVSHGGLPVHSLGRLASGYRAMQAGRGLNIPGEQPVGGHFPGDYPVAGPVQPEIEGAPGGHFAGDYPMAGPHVPSIEHPPGGPWPEGYQPVPGGPGPRETAPGGYWGGGYRATKPTVPPIERAPGGYWGGDYQATPGGPKPVTNPPGGHTFKLDLSPFDSSSVDFPDVQFPGEQAPSNVGPNSGKMIESAPAHYNTAGTHPVRQVEQYTIDQKIANQLRATGTQPHQVTPQQMNQLRSQFGHTPVRGTPAEINARLAQLQKTMQSTSAQK